MRRDDISCRTGISICISLGLAGELRSRKVTVFNNSNGPITAELQGRVRNRFSVTSHAQERLEISFEGAAVAVFSSIKYLWCTFRPL
jgi:hypothetical protein